MSIKRGSALYIRELCDFAAFFLLISYLLSQFFDIVAHKNPLLSLTTATMILME